MYIQFLNQIGGKSMTKKIYRLLAIFIAITIGFGATSTSYAQKTCVVDTNGVGDYLLIQDAVDDIECEVIKVNEGTYFENIEIDRDVIIGGSNKNQTTIDGQGTGSVINVSFDYANNIAPYISIFDITIKNGNSNNGGGIYNNRGIMVVKNCLITGNIAKFGGGGVYNDYGELTLTDSNVVNNSAGSDGGGGIFNYYSNVALKNSIIDGNKINIEKTTSIFGGGVANIANSEMSMEDCTINNNHVELLSYSPYSSTQALGGGIFNRDSSIKILTTKIINNSAFSQHYHEGASAYGGGIANIRGDITLEDCKIIKNEAIAIGDDDNYSNAIGGGLYGTYEGLETCKIKNNVPDDIYPPITVDNLTISSQISETAIEDMSNTMQSFKYDCDVTFPCFPDERWDKKICDCVPINKKIDCPVILICPDGSKFDKNTCLCELTNKPPECAVTLICPDGSRFNKKTCLCEPLGQNN